MGEEGDEEEEKKDEDDDDGSFGSPIRRIQIR